MTYLYILIVTAAKKIAIISSLLVLTSTIYLNIAPEAYLIATSSLYLFIGFGGGLGAFSFGIIASRYFYEDLELESLDEISIPVTEEDIEKEINRKIVELNDYEKSLIKGGKKRINIRKFFPSYSRIGIGSNKGY